MLIDQRANAKVLTGGFNAPIKLDQSYRDYDRTD
jgi:hypothetical protein